MPRQKRAIITGVTSGIGLEVSKSLAKLGYDLVLVGRNEAKLREIAAELEALSPNKATIDYFLCDFEQLDQMAAVSKLIGKAYREIDVVINNVGIWETKQRLNENGFDMTWTVNYFSPFVFTHQLLPTLRLTAQETQDVRIVNLTSDAHRFGKITFPLEKQPFHFFRTYGSTKLANLLHAKYLASLFAEENIRVNAVHPGVVATEFWRTLPNPVIKTIKLLMISPEEGAKTVLSVAAAPNLTASGQYFERMKSVVPSELARDTTLMNTLYRETTVLLAEFLQTTT